MPEPTPQKVEPLVIDLNNSQHARPLDAASILHKKQLETLTERVKEIQGRIEGFKQKLEKMGLVASAPGPADSRKKIMQLTTLGTDRLKEAHPHWEEAQQLMISELGDDDVQELLRLLLKVSRIAEKDSA